MSVWRARELRKTTTLAAVRLRALRPQGWRFPRQVPFLGYVPAFAGSSHRLVVVNVDGGQHTEPEQAAHDAVRDQVLLSEGFLTLRYANSSEMVDGDEAAFGIVQVLKSRTAA